MRAELAELGYQLEGTVWTYSGPRGEARLTHGSLEGLLREGGSRRLRLHAQQERDRCQER